MPDTATVAKPRSDATERLDPGWKVVLFNDDVTPITLVILAVQKAAGLSLEVAEMITNEVHENGSGVVKAGISRDEAERICEILRIETTLEGQLPGVRCEAVRND